LNNIAATPLFWELLILFTELRLNDTVLPTHISGGNCIHWSYQSNNWVRLPAKTYYLLSLVWKNNVRKFFLVIWMSKTYISSSKIILDCQWSTLTRFPQSSICLNRVFHCCFTFEVRVWNRNHKREYKRILFNHSIVRSEYASR
jgi:hypothetical protein